MNEKQYKTMAGVGIMNIVIGIVTILVGVAAGVLTIVNGARLIVAKKGLTF